MERICILLLFSGVFYRYLLGLNDLECCLSLLLFCYFALSIGFLVDSFFFFFSTSKISSHYLMTSIVPDVKDVKSTAKLRVLLYTMRDFFLLLLPGLSFWC